ncbi:hypothetical protein BC940DRAFT_320352 [Gongronella butleri]|nr:hypothetical protein BC940DRAFT_320352 [Gongronella butleri]
MAQESCGFAEKQCCKVSNVRHARFAPCSGALAWTTTNVHLLWLCGRVPHTRDRHHLEQDILALAHIIPQLEATISRYLGVLSKAVALSHFHGVHGMTDAGYIKSLGKPMLTNIDANFDDAAPVGQDGRDMWCIAVPSLDHGFLTYSPGTPGTMRFEMLY